MTLAPLLGAPVLVQVHAIVGIGALLTGSARALAPDRTPLSQALTWSFVALLAVTAATGAFLPTSADIPAVFGFTVGHLFTALTLIGFAALLWTVRAKDLVRQRAVATALFGGVLMMAALFELTPGRLLYTVLAGR